ncbi:agamous-like MADS-box protein AGL62 [Vicia villosa]|uniref:agamous-like MADS-box protein AGL62 n=1 Tax=Vicia villosa TaxID=3911 RepID=UPI00273AE580|nr:agamous-like MADS-box protein AGL62 [Vicia villosa]
MSSSSGNNTSRKHNNTSKKNPKIKKGEKSDMCRMAFSKHKLGLFNKVTELSILCKAKTALIITSPNKKMYACGYPNPDAVISHFIGKESHVIDNEIRRQDEETIEALSLQQEALLEQLQEEKNKLQEAIEANNNSSNFPNWWDYSIDDMSVESLEQYKSSLENLKLNLVSSLEGK